MEFYAPVRAMHVGAVLASGALFALRGGSVLGGAQWPLAGPVRCLSYGIDTTLLTAALMLVAMLPAAMFANHWLTAKLVLLVAYVVLGSFALKRACTARVRAFCFGTALLVFACMLNIARAHHPLGGLAD